MAEQKQFGNRPIPPAAFAPALAPSVTLTPRDVMMILRRHLILVIFLPILGLLAGGGAWFFVKQNWPEYTAERYISVLPPIEKDPVRITTPNVDKYARYDHRLTLANEMMQQNTLTDLVARDKVRQTKWFEQFGLQQSERLRKALEDLEKNLAVNAAKDGDFIKVSMTASNAAEAALILNEMVDMFIASQGSDKKRQVAARLAKRQEELVRVQRELNLADQQLDQIRATGGFLDLERDRFRDIVTERLNSLQLEENAIDLQMGQLEGSIARYEAQTEGGIDDQVQVDQLIQNDPIMVNLDQQRRGLEAQLAGMLSRLGENHRSVRQMYELINETKLKYKFRRDEIAEITRQANLANANDTLIILQQRRVELVRLRDEAIRKKRDLDQARIEYEKQMATKDERLLARDRLNQQVENLRILHDDPETIKVVSPASWAAQAPLEMSSPLLVYYLPGGTVLGMLLGVGLAFLIELLNDLVRTPRDVARHLRVPLLGVIPDAAEDRLTRDVKDLCHVVSQAPFSLVSESYRRFRANLKLSEIGASAKVLLVASAMPEDGKTSVAVNLAATLVAEDKKVLLIDAQLRRPGLDKAFPKVAEQSENPGLGLSSLLTGQCAADSIICSTGIEGFDIIQTGPMSSRPGELLNGTTMSELIAQQRENYDTIIIDGAPILMVSDSKVLAKLADATILVFNAGATRRGAAQRTIREMREIDATIVGCVLFAVRAMKGGYFREQYKIYRRYQKLQLAQTA